LIHIVAYFSFIFFIYFSMPLPLTETQRAFAATIDHTLLKAQATANDIRQLCAEAAEYGFASVCVQPYYVRLAAELLRDAPSKVCTVIGFPLGANTTIVKLAEARDALDNGARELDMVLNVGALVSGEAEYCIREIHALAELCHAYAASEAERPLLKVIIETALLTTDQKKEACRVVTLGGADFIKTSTGFAHAGATLEDVALLRENVGEAVRVKASGGIRALDFAQALLQAGASRLGVSAGVALLQELTGAPAGGASQGY
jgi:deoxyribose-phosphate aldolase